MSKALINQNLKLLQAMHHQIDFLRNFKTQNLLQIASNAHLMIFSGGSILARQNEEIDYLGIILQGKISISGSSERKSAGYVFGHLAIVNLLKTNTYTIKGDSDGIVLAFRFSQITKLNPTIRNTLTEICLKQSLMTLKGEKKKEYEWIDEQQRKAMKQYSPQLKTFFQQIEEKQKKLWLKFFPWKIVSFKDMIVNKNSDSYLLCVLKGQIGVKKQSGMENVNAGFLSNTSPNCNIFCLSQQATVMIINRKIFLNLLQPITFYNFSNFLLRQEVNINKYQIETYEQRKQKQSQSATNKWSVFNKSNQYQILPLNIPKQTIREEKKQDKQTFKKQESKQFVGTFFKEYQQSQNKNMKTNSSQNSKLTRIITMKTEKNQKSQKSSAEQKIRALQKQIEQTNARIKFYEQNYGKIKLDMIQYQSKYRMNAVFRQIQQLGQEKKHSKGQNAEVSKTTTLKDAFEQQLRQNRIMEVVARCAYKWLWLVRRKKRQNLANKSKFIET